jgi:hypothetical protein
MDTDFIFQHVSISAFQFFAFEISAFAFPLSGAHSPHGKEQCQQSGLRSFYLGDMLGTLTGEVTLGDLEHEEEPKLKLLARAILSKREYAAKASGAKEIPPNKLLNEENRLPIDKLLKDNQQSYPPD